jgi:hypothetical protein
MKTWLISDIDCENFEKRVNRLVTEGWEIVPESLRVSVSTTSNAWDAVAQTRRTLAIVLKKELNNE